MQMIHFGMVRVVELPPAVSWATHQRWLPPWFCKQLPQTTTDDIEVRICGDQGIANEDTPVELIENLC